MFLKGDFLGGNIFFFKKVLNFLSFFGLLYVSGHFKQKNSIFFSAIHIVYLQFWLVSSLLELQSKSWVLELKLEPSALQELSQSCSSDSAFRKGLIVTHSKAGNCHFDVSGFYREAKYLHFLPVFDNLIKGT